MTLPRFTALFLSAAALAACDLGELTCPPPETRCENACVDLTADARNCGACGHACEADEVCRASQCVPAEPLAATVFATCFNTGELVTLDEDLAVRGSRATVGSGPQALGLAGNKLLVADSLDNALYTFDPTQLPPAKIGAGDRLGKAANSFLVRGERAYVINSVDNTVQVLDLSRSVPDALDASRTVDEVPTGANTNPSFGAFVGDKLYVTLLGAYGPDGDAAGNRLVEIDFSTGAGVVSRELVFSPDDYEHSEPNSPRPAGIAAVGKQLFVAIGNLGETFSPAGPGYLAVVDSVTLTRSSAIRLPDTCRNPGSVLAHDGKVYVSCAGSYMGDAVEESLVVVDAATQTVLRSTLFPRCGPGDETDGPQGCRTAKPGRMTRLGDRLLIADSNAGRILVTDLEGAIPAGLEAGVAICPLKCADDNTGCYQYTSDILAVEP